MKTAMKFEKAYDGMYRGTHGVEIFRVGDRPVWWAVYVGGVRMRREYTTIAAAKSAVRKAHGIASGFATFTEGK